MYCWYAEHSCPQNRQDIEDVKYSSDSDSEKVMITENYVNIVNLLFK